MFNRIIVLLMLASLVVVGMIATGCTSDNVDVEIKPVQSADDAKGKDGLDPLTRGKVRRQILTETQEDINIWLKGDEKNYDKAFTKDLAKGYRAQLEKLRKDGQDKVRIHENTSLEVVELKSPTEGTVKYNFDDKSYFIYTKTKKIAKPAKPVRQDRQSEFEMIVIKEGGRWKIGAMIGAGEATL